MEGGLAQGVSQNAAAALEIFDEAQRAKAGQGRSLMGRVLILLWVIHMRRTLPGPPTLADLNGVWDRPAAGPTGDRAASATRERASTAVQAPGPQAAVISQQRGVERTGQLEHNSLQVALTAELVP
jgi:hypothetical protein